MQGRPAVFVRLAKCQLDCSFCDTFFDDGDWLTVKQIMEQSLVEIAKFHGLEDINDHNAREIFRITQNAVLVATGGEPMLQDNLGLLLEAAADLFGETQIESNGLLLQSGIPESTCLVISPKCSEKTNRYFPLKESTLERANALKFVISADPDSPYHTIPDWALQHASRIPIYVSPMNVYNDIPRQSKELRMTTNMTSLKQRSEIDEVISFWTPDLLNREENQKNHEYAARYALKNGLRLNLQLHLFASLA